MAPNRLTLMAMCGAVVVTLTGSIVSAAPMENPTAQKIELPSSTGELKPIVETLSALPDYSTLVAAVGATNDGGAIVDALAAAGPFTAGMAPRSRFVCFALLWLASLLLGCCEPEPTAGWYSAPIGRCLLLTTPPSPPSWS
jgi:hypothetical protein